MRKDKQIRILNVEDEEVDHIALMSILNEKHLPYDIDHATSIVDTMALIEKNRYDLLLIDYMMPDGTGLELLGKLKETVSIFITGSGDETVAVKAMKRGAYDYIIKDPAKRYLELLPVAVEKALNTAKLEKERKESKKWLCITLKSIGDAVIATDTKGCVKFMNPVAQFLTGWKEEDALGRPLGEVFDIKNEENYLELESPTAKLIHENMDIGLSNRMNHILIAKEGRQIPIADSSAPIRDDRGNIIGEVLVFADITEQKKREDALREYSERLKEMADENRKLYFTAQKELAERKLAEEQLQDSLNKLRKLLGGTIQVLASIIEIRDPYTAGHQRRVSDLARAIATEIGLSENQIDGIRTAGVIHDIGKISIPSEILSKPGRLTEIEFCMIKNHPQIGHDILKDIEFPWPIAQIVLQHHERMNGSGYPQGLAGKDILMEARILAVADVVEAMSSHRPYRSALGIDKALETISQNKGILYDPQVVNACVKLFTEKGYKFIKQ